MKQLNAIVVELNISCWGAKGIPEAQQVLKPITDYVAMARNEFYKMTLPWSDSGQRLVPITQYEELKQWVSNTELEFNSMVNDIVVLYPEAQDKFRFKVGFLPLPAATDFKVDEYKFELEQQYGKIIEERVSALTEGLRQELHTCLKHMSERLTTGENGKVKVFRSSLVDNAVDLSERLTRLNITDDKKLETTRCKLAHILDGLDPHELREDDAVREATKKQIDAVLASWS